MSPWHERLAAPSARSVEPRSATRRRLALAGAVFALGAALSVGATVLVRASEARDRRHALERRSAEVALAIQRGFDAPLEALRSITSLFEASASVDRREFRAFVRAPLARHPSVYALEWIPRVPASERVCYEAAAAADGLEGFHFKQDAPQGSVVPAEPRAEYFPLFYMEPPNRVALGIEETALPVRREALERARDTADTAFSGRLKLVQDPAGVASVIAFHPLYAEAPGGAGGPRVLRGFAAAVLRVRTVVESALSRTNLDGLDVALLDDGATAQEAVLFESAAGASTPGGRAAWDHRIELGGRTWTVRARERGGIHAATGWPVLAGGLAVSVLAALLVSVVDAARALRRLVRAARRLGQYTLGERLGSGGMGAVYEASHVRLRRPTAIKLLSAPEGNPDSAARFEREAQMTSRLTHPNTIVVYDYGRTPDGTFYYAMEHLEGLTLDELVRAEGRLPPARAARLLDQVCASLAEAHAIGLVHRDVKPANVMVCSRAGLADFVKVLDFGLVKEVAGPSDLAPPPTRSFLGTPLYAAPEAIRAGGEVDARADLYAVGALAFFLLTGEAPFGGGSVLEVCAHHLSTPADPPSTRGALDVPAGLDAVVLRCLAKQPGERFASAEELRAAIAAIALAPWTQADAARWWSDRGDALARELRERRRREAGSHDALRGTALDPVLRARPS